LRADARRAARVLTAARPELAPAQAESMVWAALSVGASLSNHTFAPPRRRFERLLRELLSALFAVRCDGHPARRPDRPVPPDPPPAGRREELLVAAVRLFHERGFDNVTTDRLGAAVGIAGPSVYKHFPTKAELLAAALVRSRERLWHEVTEAVAGAAGPAEALDRALGAYLDFARRHHHYLGAMVSETHRLAEPDRKAALDFRRDFLRIWVGLLRQVRPGYDNAEARIRVHAMFGLVNDAVRHPGRLADPALTPCLEHLAHAVLGLPRQPWGALTDPPAGAPPGASRPV
jgi:AcrR family transcriptional regulator